MNVIFSIIRNSYRIFHVKLVRIENEPMLAMHVSIAKDFHITLKSKNNAKEDDTLMVS